MDPGHPLSKGGKERLMDDFAIQVELDAPEPTLDQLDVLMDGLAAFAGTWGAGHGRLQACLTVRAETLRTALVVGIELALDAATQAGLRAPRALAATGSIDALSPPGVGLDDLLSTGEVARRLGITRQAVVKQAAKLGGRQVGTAWVFSAARIDSSADARSARAIASEESGR